MAAFGTVLVPDGGPVHARIIAIGEAPADHEVANGYPFAGPSGWRLNEWLTQVGLTRQRDVYVCNVYQYQAPHNKIDLVPRETLELWMDYLHARIAALQDPWVLVPMGNCALFALTGKGKPPWQRGSDPTRPGITRLRGSIYEYTDQQGRRMKVIPTPHPAATFREPGLERTCRVDWERIAREAQQRDWQRPQREHLIKPTLAAVEEYVYHVEEQGEPLSIDIERPPVMTQTLKKDGTPKKLLTKDYTNAVITCVGFSHKPTFSLTVPTTLDYWGTQAHLDRCWALVKRLCENDLEKILQNGFFDAYNLWWEQGIWLENWVWDTLHLHHAWDASDEHSLDYQASVFTNEPFWKTEAKDPEEAGKWATNFDAFQVYCGKDASVTWELYAFHKRKLEQQGRLPFYLKHYAELHSAFTRLSLTGIRVDAALRKAKAAEMAETLKTTKVAITEATGGFDLFGKTSISGAKLKAYMYDVLRLPKRFVKRKDKGEKTLSSDKVAIRRAALKSPEKFGAVAELLLQFGRADKLRQFYNEGRVDPDGRFRGQYGLNTEAGRTNCKENPRGTGSNLENQDREIRDMFLADEGCVFVEVDLSQAEARDVYLAIYHLTGNTDMLWKARARPDEYDQHTENAALIFSKSPAEVTKQERFLGKKTVHGAMRGLQGNKFSDSLAAEGWFYTPEECQVLLDAYVAKTPGLVEYFRWVREQIIAHKRLVNAWGRVLRFDYDRMDDDTYRRGYSYLPQSNVADHMNQLGFKPLMQAWERRAFGEGWQINVHNHDSLGVSAPPLEAYPVLEFLVTQLEQPTKYYGVEHVLPCEITIGLTWKGEAHEWKRLPSREAFEEVARGLV